MAVAAARRRADGDEDGLGGLGRLGQVGGEGQPALATFLATSSARPGSKIGISPALQRGDLVGVLVDAGDVVAEIGKAGAGDQADIAGTDHRYAHGLAHFIGQGLAGVASL